MELPAAPMFVEPMTVLPDAPAIPAALEVAPPTACCGSSNFIGEITQLVLSRTPNADQTARSRVAFLGMTPAIFPR
jgi:hypothetical protein